MNTEYREWITLSISVIIVIGLPALVFRGDPVGSFDRVADEYEIQSVEPDYVFIGNSMLDTRINPILLSELADGQKIHLLSNPGVMSAAWYLQLKNHVVEADVRPKAVFITFRANTLTDPLRATRGVYRDILQRLQIDSEPDFDAVIASNADFSYEMGSNIQSVYPIQSRRLHAEEAISRLAAGILSPELLIDSVRHVLGTISPDAYRARLDDHLAIKRETNEVFDRINLRSDSAVRSNFVVVEDFHASVDKSFLPLIIEQARSIDLPLIFVRLQTRPNGDGTLPLDPKLDSYITDLRDYIESNGSAFIDMAGHPNIRFEHYLDGDHIRPDYKDTYTRFLYDSTSIFFE
jgi:hypothetical protein